MGHRRDITGMVDHRLPIRWPAEMRAETAALYVDEPSVAAFRRKVELGVYCDAVRAPHCQPKWNREKLDACLRLRHNLRKVGETPAEDITDLI